MRKIKDFGLFLEGYGIMGTQSTNRLETFYKDGWEGKDLILQIMECLKKLDVGVVSTYYNSDVADVIVVDGGHFLLWYPYDYARYQSPKNYDIITFFISNDQFIKNDKVKQFANQLKDLFKNYSDGPDKDGFYMISLKDTKNLIEDLEHEMDDNFSGISKDTRDYNV